MSSSGSCNAQGLRIPVPCFWDLNKLEALLGCYHDKEALDFLKYGWPISHDGRHYNTKKLENWRGAVLNKDSVRKYLENELKYRSVIGPFHSNPFNQEAGISPLNTRDKKDSVEKRIILDLSFPEGNAVNEGIDKTKYLGLEIEWKLPTVDTLANLMVLKGVGSLLFKRDLRRYYRQIFVDPSDVAKLGYYLDDLLYFDATLPMGMTSSCYIAQRVSSMITFIMQQQGYSCVNYIDDLGGVDTSDKAMRAFNELGSTLDELNILESKSKASEPTTSMVFLGIKLDSVEQTVSIDAERLTQIKQLTAQWLNKSVVTLKELQSLIGVLSFAASCVREGRLFFSRLLNLLKECKKSITLSIEAKKDIRWWHTFLADYNGVSLIPSQVWNAPDTEISTDSCLTGCGAVSKEHYMHFEIPNSIRTQGKYINQFELYAVIIAVREWKKHLQNLNVLLYCDNQTTVQVLQSGKVSCPFMQKCLREIRFHSAKFNFRVRAVYLNTSDNRLADCLSRWYLASNYSKTFLDLTKNLKLTETIVSNFEIDEIW